MAFQNDSDGNDGSIALYILINQYTIISYQIYVQYNPNLMYMYFVMHYHLLTSMLKPVQLIQHHMHHHRSKHLFNASMALLNAV